MSGKVLKELIRKIFTQVYKEDLYIVALKICQYAILNLLQQKILLNYSGSEESRKSYHEIQKLYTEIARQKLVCERRKAQ